METDQPRNTSERGEGDHVALLIKAGLLCLVISVITIFGYDRLFAQKIVAIDTTPYLQNVQAEFLKGKMSEDDLNKRLEILRSMISKQPRNHILIVSDMVVSKNVKTIKP
jgi:dephospho-CoA kinase